MSLQLHCKRSKIFIQSGSRTVKCGRNETTSVPNWVRGTLGYKHGIADGSIIDLTPGSGAAGVPATDATETELRARIAELEAQLHRKHPAPQPAPSDESNQVVVDDSGTVDDDPTSVVDLSTAKSTAETAGEAASGAADPKTGKPTKPAAAKGLQGGRTK